MTDIPASAFDTRDCAFPLCPNEARGIDGMCEDHRGRTPAAPTAPIRDHSGRLIPGSLAHLMEDEEKEQNVADQCKVDGCANANAGKGGWTTGLCQEHINEGMRRRQESRHKTAPAPAPSTPHSAPSATPRSSSDSLTELAAAVETADSELALARTRREEALARLRQAVEAA